MTRRKRAHKIQMKMGETSGRLRDGRNRGMNMSLNLTPVAKETDMSPKTHVSVQTRPQERAKRSLLNARTPG